MHIPTRFIKRHAYQYQFSGSCRFSALYANASFLAFTGLRVKAVIHDIEDSPWNTFPSTLTLEYKY